MRSGCIPVLAFVVVTSANIVRAEWKPPKDNAYTEKQLTEYIAAMKENMQTLKAAGKAIEGGQSGFGAMAVYSRTDSKMKATIARHGFSEEEYQWVGNKIFEAWGGLFMQQAMESAQADMDKSLKTNQDQIKQNQEKLAAYEKAQKEGRRVMTKEERESAIKSAKEDQESALEEAKQHADEAKAAKAEAEKAEAEAKAADAAAKNPPANLSDDDRQSFIDEKKGAAESARNSAKDARDRQAEAEKAQKESQARSAAAAGRLKNPDLPTTEDDKSQVKQQNEEMVKQLRSEIENSQQALKLLDESKQETQKRIKEQQAQVPPQNLALLKKHQKEWEDIWGMKDKK